MPVVAVINRKGGSGKSTLATHLAAYCSTRGFPVMLGDTDRNQSSMAWLRMREHNLPSPGPAIIGRWVDPRSLLRPPPGTNHVVLDTPGGLHGFELARLMCHADAVLLPVCNSLFDRESAAECWAEMKDHPRVTSGRCKVAAVGMRLDARTKGGEVLALWAQAMGLPYLGALRETQGYVRCVENGLTLFDLPPATVAADMVQWAPILKWLKPVLEPELSAQEQIQRRITRPVENQDAPPMGITIPGGLGGRLPVLAAAAPRSNPAMPSTTGPSTTGPRTRAMAPVTLTERTAPPALLAAASGDWSHRLGKMLGGLQLRRFLLREP